MADKLFAVKDGDLVEVQAPEWAGNIVEWEQHEGKWVGIDEWGFGMVEYNSDTKEVEKFDRERFIVGLKDSWKNSKDLLAMIEKIDSHEVIESYKNDPLRNPEGNILSPGVVAVWEVGEGNKFTYVYGILGSSLETTDFGETVLIIVPLKFVDQVIVATIPFDNTRTVKPIGWILDSRKIPITLDEFGKAPELRWDNERTQSFLAREVASSGRIGEPVVILLQPLVGNLEDKLAENIGKGEGSNWPHDGVDWYWLTQAWMIEH